MFGAESVGTPDARNVYYNYPASGDGNVRARLDHIAAAKNPARKPGNGDKFYVTGIPVVMTRLARVVVEGVPHHITQRGNRRQPTFFQPEDYPTYLDLMEFPGSIAVARFTILGTRPCRLWTSSYSSCSSSSW